jgi:thymidine kinase
MTDPPSQSNSISKETYRRMHLLIDSADAYDKLSARCSGCTSTTVVHHHQTGRLSLAHVARPTILLA